MTTLKILGQVAPSATTETDLYTVPGSTSTVVSTITVCNRSASPVLFRISASVAGGATATKDYIYYDATVAANDTFSATLGITLAATDKLRVYASANTLSFSAFGQENS